MEDLISLNEAASLLGVSKETLRNWDKTKKLKSVRNPDNNYRNYRLGEVKAMTYQPGLFPSDELTQTVVAPAPSGHREQSDFKRSLGKLHRALRDTDGSSNIIERFDELAKLLFLKGYVEKKKVAPDPFIAQFNDSAKAYATRLRALLASVSVKEPALFPARFRTLTLSDQALLEAGKTLSQLTLSNLTFDYKGVAFEEVIKNTFDKGDNQQFFTPKPIVEFLVSAMEPYLKGAVCDPACGTGGFLVEVARRLPATQLTGLEIDERLAWISGINLYLHGAKRFRTARLDSGGTLGKEGRDLAGEFDAIITNPPFGSDLSDPSDLSHFELGKGRSSRRRGILFIERCLHMLKDGGHLGIVIDEGALSLPSNQDVRALILQRSEILAVFSLPETAFMPYASVNSSILILRKTNKPRQSRPTFFGKSECAGRKPNGEPDVIYDSEGKPNLNSDLGEILRHFSNFLRDHSSTVVKSNAFSSVISHSLENDKENRVDFLYHHPSKFSAQDAINRSKWEVKRLGDISLEKNETVIPSVDLIDQVIPYTGLAQIESQSGVSHQIFVPADSLKSAVKRYEKGDILFSRMRPGLRKCVLVEHHEPGYASAECSVLQVKTDDAGHPMIDPGLLSTLLRSDLVFGQLIHHISGIGRPRVSVENLRNVLIPVPPVTRQKQLRKELDENTKSYQRLTKEAERLEAMAAKAQLQIVVSAADGVLR
jgi:type I restriction enzyme M protein